MVQHYRYCTVFFSFRTRETATSKNLLEEQQALHLPKGDCVAPLFKSPVGCFLLTNPHSSVLNNQDQ